MYHLSFFPHRLRMSASYSEHRKRKRTCRRLADFAYLCDDAGRTSPRAGRRAGPPRVPSMQAGAVAEATNAKGPPQVEKRAAKREERSDSHAFNDTVLDLQHIFMSDTEYQALAQFGYPTEVHTMPHSSCYFWSAITAT